MDHPLDVIATTILEVDGEPGFTIRIRKPVLDPEGDCWYCHYDIEGPITKREMFFGGHDAMQALINALYAIGVDIEMSAEYVQGRLSLDGDKSDFGFPSRPRR